MAIDRAAEIGDYIAQDKRSAAEKWIKTVQILPISEIMSPGA